VQLALISDVHANLEALDAVLDDVARRSPRAQLVCAGDVVGYGPDPEACIARLRDAGAVQVTGNHEEMLLGSRDFSRCVYAGIHSALWTRDRLSREAHEFLSKLPSWADAAPGVVVCHGDLTSADRYVSTVPRAHLALEQLRAFRPEARVLVCGHTHQQVFFTDAEGLRPMAPGDEAKLPADGGCLINPGSVGQERRERATRERPLARYAWLDLERGSVWYCGVPYDHAATLRKLRRAGLVAQVVLTPSRGMQRHLERLKLSWARRRAARASA
jgi:predicted phosphodiesterase